MAFKMYLKTNFPSLSLKIPMVCSGRVGEREFAVLASDFRSIQWRATSLSLPTFQHGGQCPRHLGYLQAQH